MVYTFISNIEIDGWYSNIVNFDKFFAPYVAEQKIRRDHAKLLEEVAELRQKNAALTEEITELRLRPGGPDYENAKSHFEEMVEKQ